MITMDWIKKNWITIAVVVLVVAVIIYFIKNKKPKRLGAKVAGGGGGASAALKAQLASCEQSAQAMRMIPGSEHPCTKLRNAVAESGYFVQGGESNYGNISDKINVVDYAIGGQGMSMLEENNFNLPSFKVRPAESNYDALSTTNGLNVIDFASGLEGTSLLMDRNLRRPAESGYTNPKEAYAPALGHSGGAVLS